MINQDKLIQNHAKLREKCRFQTRNSVVGRHRDKEG